MDFVEQCYRLTATFPKTETYGLVNQMRRAAVSIPSNIAEGDRRGTTPGYLNHVRIALGSHGEIETYIELSSRLRFITPEQREKLLDACGSVGRLLNGLHRALEHKLEVKTGKSSH